jgi:hypothetical protein
LVARHGHDLRYCYESGSWLVWDDGRWAADTSGEVIRRAKETADTIYAEIPRGFTKEEQEMIFRHARASGSKNALKNMVEATEKVRAEIKA